MQVHLVENGKNCAATSMVVSESLTSVPECEDIDIPDSVAKLCYLDYHDPRASYPSTSATATVVR